MKTVLVTGSSGFIGRNVTEALRQRADIRVIRYDLGSTPQELDLGLSEADFIIHLAGVNRPTDVNEFNTGNTGFTEEICERLTRLRRTPTIIISSSIQADLDNPYGVSKKNAEIALAGWSEKCGSEVIVFRLKNVFGKWCRPNYNSVTATFCYNISRGLPISISDPARVLELIYVDDIVASFIGCLDAKRTNGCSTREVIPSYKITLGNLAELINSFRESRQTLLLPSFEDGFTRRLYATYLSYLQTDDFAYNLPQKVDARGVLAEFMKSAHFGQLFVSRTKPHITRGNHFHHTKVEKFLVLEGEATIRFRHIEKDEVIEYKVLGSQYTVLDIPPGYAHSIENTGTGELLTLFWASEIFDPAVPDVYPLTVK